MLPTRHVGIVLDRPFSGLQVRSQSEARGHLLSRPKMLEGETLGKVERCILPPGLAGLMKLL